MRLEPVSNQFGETILRGVASSGLTLWVNPRPGFVRTFAAFGTNFGSVDRVGGVNGQPVPDGLAHFLEHKLFEDQQGDVSDRFSALGASTNAMTGFCGTTYIFSTVGAAAACLDLLLDFVQDPWFTEELVAKEQGIIAQEIRMYDDDPDWRVFFGLLGALYERHPVRDNIAGTVESIQRIDASTLRRCYQLFYHPRNMALAVAGAVDPDAVAALVERDQATRGLDPRSAHERRPQEEPAGRVRERAELVLPVSRPRLLMGIKETVLGGDGSAVSRRELLTRILLDMLFGRSSRAFESLYEEGLVDETFSASYSGESDFGFTLVGGDTDEPARLEARLREVLASARTTGLDAAAFGRVRTKLLGQLLRGLDSLERTCFGLLSGHFRGTDPFVALELVEGLRLTDVEQRLREHVRDDALATSLLKPHES